jgi:hypothetical protein
MLVNVCGVKFSADVTVCGIEGVPIMLLRDVLQSQTEIFLADNIPGRNRY